MRRVVAALFASLDGYATDAPDERMWWLAEGEETAAFSVDLVGSLMQLGLIDRLQLQVHPIVLGPAGGRAIFDGYETTRLRLVESTVLDGRVVVLDYHPLPAGGGDSRREFE